MDKLMYEIGELKHRIKQDENKLREMYLFDDATFQQIKDYEQLNEMKQDLQEKEHQLRKDQMIQKVKSKNQWEDEKIKEGEF